MTRILTLLFLLLLARRTEAQPLPAFIEVRCPADVALTIQGQRMASTGPLRRFASPPLPPGRYVYELRVFRGEREIANREVEVAAGLTSYLTIDEPVPNFGIDVDALQSARPLRAELNGREISSREVRRLLGDDSLPDPQRRRLTVIGSPGERQQALTELSGPLHDLVADYVVQDYAPDHWAVNKPGFVTSGRPTLYAQEPDGRVLFRQDDLPGLRKNLEAVRKPSPDYHPDRDPDYRKSPLLPISWEDALPMLSISAAAWFVWKARHATR